MLVRSIADLGTALKGRPDIAFVPTMGNLHAGHIRLVEIAKRHGQYAVVSIFVNPLQFGQNEDLDKYPRTLEADCAKLETAGADIVFAPAVSEIYPAEQTMTVEPPPIASELCGASRPGHFRGVATVVMKLFNIVQPKVAVFGKKDFQQLFIIREMVRQFNLPIDIIGGETVRETDGLAMSSRNGYLDRQQRMEAANLHIALQQAAQAIISGLRDYAAIEKKASEHLDKRGWLVDYISVRSAQTLAPALANDRELVVLGAAKLGGTRLIDNIEFCANPLK